MEDTGGIADFIGERWAAPKAATEPATVEVSNLWLTCGAACCKRSTTPQPFKLKTTMQGLEQNGNERDKRVATPPPRKAAGGTPNDSMLMSMSHQARRANSGPKALGRVWPFGPFL